MKSLCLIRHAHAGWNPSTPSDFDRPLSGQGEAEARSMGAMLAAGDLRPGLILSSPAVRALATAEIIAAEVGYAGHHIKTRAGIYDGSMPDWIQIIRQIGDIHKNVFLVGHNPTITEVVNSLTDSSLPSIPTCGAARVESTVRTWSELDFGSARLISLDLPLPGNP